MTLKFPKPVKVERKRKPLRRRRHTKTIVRKEHEFLYGTLAHVYRRIQIFERAGGRLYIERDAEGRIEAIYTAHPATCQACETGHPVTWEDGDWIHTEKRHCDCLSCGIFGCRNGHIRNFHHGREF